MIKLANAYAARDQIKRAGGKFDGASKCWLVSEEQLATLTEWAAESAARSNKRDTQFGRDWARVEIIRKA